MTRHPGQPDNTYTAAQLEIIGCGSYSGVCRRYKSIEEDLLHKIVVNGNSTRCYPFHLLTAKDQAKVRKYEFEQQLATVKAIAEKVKAESILAEPPPAPPRIYHTPAQLAGAAAARRVKEQEALAIEDRRQRQEMLLAMFNSLPETAKKAAEARHTMLEACQTFLKEGDYKSRGKDGRAFTWSDKGLKDFCSAFIDGTLEISSEVAETFTRKGKRSLTTVSLLNWRDAYEEQGLYGIADHYVSKTGATSLTTAQQDFVIGMIHDHPHVFQTKVHKAMKTRFKGAAIPSKHTVGRFMEHWKQTHIGLYQYIVNPDQWRSKHMFAYGSASEDVIRLNQRWEADSTKADVLCTDGRCCVIGIIDVWSRRFLLHVSPTSKATAIAALFRCCLIDWGTPEELRTDCGSDYTSFHIERICDFLEVNHHLCDEFQPQQKPHIERAFKTFSHGIVELLEGYCGHSVADRKDIEARKSFATRMMTKGEAIDVKLTMAELQTICDQWTEAIYSQDKHAGLDGMTPAAKARTWTALIPRITNERALDILLSPAPSNNGLRKIGKEGVQVTFHGAKLNYMAGEFAGHEGETVQVLIDETDLGKAPIFRENGEFFCLATDPHWYGISRQELALQVKKNQKELLAEQKKETRQIARKANTRGIATEIIKDRCEQAEKIKELPKPATEYTTPALEQAAVAVQEMDRKTAEPRGSELSAEQIRKSEELLNRKPLEKPKTMLDVSIEYERKIKAGTATPYEIEYAEAYRIYEDTGKRTGPLQLRAAG